MHFSVYLLALCGLLKSLFLIRYTLIIRMDSSDKPAIKIVQTSGKTTDFSSCVICQSDDKGSLRKAKESSISKLIELWKKEMTMYLID